MIPMPTIRRLPMYLSFLKGILREDTKFISAPAMAMELQVDPTQITKDFSSIEIKGKTKLGYDIETLINGIENYLGFHVTTKAFIVGIGSLGITLLKYNEFSKEGMEILAGFDIDKEKAGQTISGVRILDLDKFKERFTKTSVEIGIITVPGDQAQMVANLMIESGLKAIWNFSSRPVSAPKNIIVENTSINSSLAMIKWKLNKNKPLIYKNRVL